MGTGCAVTARWRGQEGPERHAVPRHCQQHALYRRAAVTRSKTWEALRERKVAHGPRHESGKPSNAPRHRPVPPQRQPIVLRRLQRSAELPGKTSRRSRCREHPRKPRASGVGRATSLRSRKQRVAAGDGQTGADMKARKQSNTLREHQQRNVPGKGQGARVTKAGRRQTSGGNVRETAGSVVRADASSTPAKAKRGTGQT